MDVAALLSTISAAIGFARELSSVDVQVDQASLKLKIAELTGALADAKLGLIDVAEAMRALQAEVDRLSAFTVELAGKQFTQGFYFDRHENGEPRGTPFCPYCIDRKVGMYHLRQLDKPGRPWGCPHCKNEYRHAPYYNWDLPEAYETD